MIDVDVRARARAQLVATAVSIERGGRPVLVDLSVSVTPGTRLGVVGENGRGKSTLLHILSGSLQPDEGSVTRVGSLGLAEQELEVSSSRTVGELIDVELADARAALRALEDATVALSEGRDGSDAAYAAALDAATVLDAWDADRRVDLALAELSAISDRTRRLSEMSVGERYRVRLACLLGADHDILLLDEPTNHLDQHGLEFLTTALRDHAGGVVVVSHDRALLRDVATKILDLDPTRDGRARVYGEGYDGYVTGRAAELLRWEQEFEQHRAEEARLADGLSAAQNRLRSGWRPPKGTGKHQRATRAPSLVRAVNRRLDDLADHAVSRPVAPLRFHLPELPALPGTTVVHADRVAVEGRLDGPVTVTLESGGRLLVTGPNGAGKSTLLHVLAGRLRPEEGTISIAPAARVGVVAQESPSVDTRRVHDVYEGHLHELRYRGIDDTVALASLGLLSSADAGRRLAELSMGQQRRLDLALALAGRPHLLLLDEPTNHLSIALVDELTEAFDASGAAIVVVTHDRQLRRDLSDWPELALERRSPGAPTRAQPHDHRASRSASASCGHQTALVVHSDEPSALFRFDGEHLVPTALSKGPWYEGTLHGSPMLAAMAWAAERHPSDVPREVVRLTVDLIRAAPLSPLRVVTETLHAGKSLDVVDARLFAGDDLCVRATAQRMRTTELEVEPEPSVSEPPTPPVDDDLGEPFFGRDDGGETAFHHAIDLYGDPSHPVPLAWFRLNVPVVEGEVTSGFVTIATLCDWTYAVPVVAGHRHHGDDSDAADGRRTFGIDTDTTVSCFRPLVGEWVGIRTRSLVGDHGAGVSGAELFDAAGPLGFSSQSVLVRGVQGAPLTIKETQ
nr:ATP-binding cassette domain-containing protein [Actinomarinicola tropica]